MLFSCTLTISSKVELNKRTILEPQVDVSEYFKIQNSKFQEETVQLTQLSHATTSGLDAHGQESGNTLSTHGHQEPTQGEAGDSQSSWKTTQGPLYNSERTLLKTRGSLNEYGTSGSRRCFLFIKTFCLFVWIK